jgi:hypothetical protein
MRKFDGFVSYMDIKGPIRCSEKSVICQVDSLSRVDAYGYVLELLILDEIESILT